MKINSVVLTKHNLQEMVKDWGKEMTQAITLVSNNPEYTDAHNMGILKLRKLQERMNNIIAG